jgi:uncharacterized repeat protein (TIGR03803 family)
MDYSVLHSFAGTDGSYPYASVIYVNGILYGTTVSGGVNNNGLGTLFSFDLSSNNVTTLYSFTNSRTSGSQPHASVIYANSTKSSIDFLNS